MSCDEFKHLCRKIWVLLVWIDPKREIKESVVIMMKAKNTYIECTPETKIFQR